MINETRPTLRKAPPGKALVFSVALLFAAFCHVDARPKANEVNLIPTITSLNVVNGQLVASGTATAILHGEVTTVPFVAPLNIALAPDQNGTGAGGAGACPVLDLTLGPINLDLLGLVVETSPICLTITAFEGGGLLGDLLCAVGNLLNGGLALDQILGGLGVGTLPGLTPVQIGNLLGAVTDLVNTALSNLVDAVVTDILQATGAACDILHLELGPLELNLLGLEVILDDCDGGPVVLDITGERGRGNLLGNLLCGLLGSGGIGLGDILGDILGEVLPGRAR